MNVRSIYDLSESEKLAHEAKWGKYNDLPAGWTQISEEEFAKSSYFTYGAEVIEYRQMYARDENGDRSFVSNPVISAHLHFFPQNVGFAIVADYWKGKLTFYKFGCLHVWGAVPEEKRAGIHLFRCQSASWCAKCQTLNIVDSSD